MNHDVGGPNAAGIAVIGGHEEPEVKRLVESLTELEQTPLVIDTAQFPWLHHLSFVGGRWSYNGQPLWAIRVYFLRNLNCNPNASSTGASALAQASTAVILREKDSILGSLLRLAASHGCAVVNPIDTLRCHFYKLDTVERLRLANIRVPATLGTNDFNEVRRFGHVHRELIYKPLAGGSEAVALSPDDLDAVQLDQIRIAPVLIQERVYGDDIRAYVLAGEVIGAASLSTECVDFRTGPQDFEAVDLTPAESAAVIESARLMSLDFASVDFKRSSTGDYAILDINPAPMFAGFEMITGLDIAGQLARYLVQKAAA